MNTIEYRVRDSHKGDPRRTVKVDATPGELERFVRDGYLVRPQLIGPEHLDRLRAALAKVAASEGAVQGGADIFLRDLMDKHPVFLELLRYQPTLSVARALLGPAVQTLPLSARIAFPGQEKQFVTWHFHQRIIPEPYPPFFTRPHVLDSLIYLDDADEANGPLVVVPGTHERLHEDLPASEQSLPGEVTLMPKAGDVVMLHGALWHRALPTTAAGKVRRLLICLTAPCGPPSARARPPGSPRICSRPPTRRRKNCWASGASSDNSDTRCF